MNKELFENQWTQIRPFIRDKWSNLTDEDIRQINGRYDQLVTKLQQRYGYSREEAEDEIRNWAFDTGTRTYGYEKPYAREEKKTEATTSPLTWLLAAGIPLLLLAGYIAYENSKAREETFATPKTVTRDATFLTTTPEDNMTTQSIRNALNSNDRTRPAVRAIRIETANGVVTITGVVSTNQERDLIARIVENVDGVREIDNQLEVR